ncbi:MAG: alpha/beta hydrolase [Bacteroidales bacterium]|nr:alpha/beta hydrolase [Bacteroidales bacterium]
MQSFIEFRQGKIFFRDEGHGKPIVLIHGFLENLNMWIPMAKTLSQSFRVITIDLPGHGRSDVFGKYTTMDLMATAVNEVLETLSIFKAVVIGHSMGGYVAQTFAELYPEKLAGLGYFHSHAAADSPEAKINRGRAIKIVEENHANFISSFIPDLFAQENKTIYAKEIDWLKTEAQKMTKEGIISALQAMRERRDGTKLLAQLHVPIMFIIGKSDPRMNPELMKLQTWLPKKSHVLLLENVGHMGYLESFEPCTTFLKGFVEACSS